MYYTDLCTGRSIKKQLIVSFGQQFKKSHENLKKIIFQSHVSDLDKKTYSKFSYCYTGLGARCSSKKNNYSLKSTLRKIKRLLCSGNINGNKNITW